VPPLPRVPFPHAEQPPGPSYRAYFARGGETTTVLLAGATNGPRFQDISIALKLARFPVGARRHWDYLEAVFEEGDPGADQSRAWHYRPLKGHDGDRPSHWVGLAEPVQGPVARGSARICNRAKSRASARLEVDCDRSLTSGIEHTGGILLMPDHVLQIDGFSAEA
jgi:hypothetical protein